MKIIDSHCHLDGLFKDGHLEAALLRASNVGVKHFVVIGTDSEDCQINAELAKKFDQISYTIGLHPLNIDADGKMNFERFFSGEISAENQPCAIGEIGLDYHYLPDNDDREKIVSKQKEVFRKQLNFAKSHNLPVAIHSREAFEDTFEILANSGLRGDKIVFHCFGYSPHEIAILMEFGAYVSFSGNVTYKNASPIREALKLADKNKVLLETDCPYLAPMPYRGQKNEPVFIKEIAEFVAEFLGDDHFVDRTFENTVKFFGLKITTI